MTETAFALTYEGDALGDGRMPVRDLAPALLALGELFMDASATVAPGKPPAALDIQAVERGSFVAHLIVTDWEPYLTNLLTSPHVDAALNLVSIVTDLFLISKLLRGHRAYATEDGPGPGEVRITLDDGTTLVVRGEALRLYTQPETRRRAREVVAPLRRAGVNRLSISRDHVEIVRVEETELDSFELPTDETKVAETPDVTMVLRITNAAFVEGNKWRLSDGDRTFYAAIRDEHFLAAVDRGEPFAKGDMLRCRLRIVQFANETAGLRTEYEVLEVLDHIKRPEQLSLLQVAETAPDEPPGPLGQLTSDE